LYYLNFKTPSGTYLPRVKNNKNTGTKFIVLHNYTGWSKNGYPVFWGITSVTQHRF